MFNIFAFHGTFLKAVELSTVEFGEIEVLVEINHYLDSTNWYIISEAIE